MSLEGPHPPPDRERERNGERDRQMPISDVRLSSPAVHVHHAQTSSHLHASHDESRPEPSSVGGYDLSNMVDPFSSDFLLSNDVNAVDHIPTVQTASSATPSWLVLDPGSVPPPNSAASHHHTASSSGIYSSSHLEHNNPPSQSADPPNFPPSLLSVPVPQYRLAELARLNSIPITRDMPLEDVGPWSAMSEILSVYLRYLHALFPLVHKPSFSQRLAMRHDQVDRGFAALILGIAAYTIGQSPLGRLGNYTRQELHWLQKRCHQASWAKLDRRYSTITVNQLATLMTGYFYCQSIGETNRAIAILAEACQLAHVLCLRTPVDEADHVERELRRRAFWHIYAVDATEASAGQPIHLNTFEGFPPIPLPVDDEILTIQGSFPSNASLSSALGFIAITQIFPHQGECIARQRRYRHRMSIGEPYSPLEVQVEKEWIERSKDELARKMESLPRALRDPDWVEDGSEERRAVLGMQRANILVTEASVQFTLLSYADDLETNPEKAAEERTRIGRTSFAILSSLPLDDLAANGESMRGKIFRIMLDMLRGDNPSEWVTELQDWCALYSRVQYVQLATNDLVGLFDSRAPSPI
ncbi:hypothetical protein DB88DRAFT_510988 [Papiliotrema laurentii]|uniref:Xylanolytic transcriptional activator regulatory domain-containing protein n=1 Tax=Papiliotrema laurentii TaxID=5418 RepID=A0AAD9CWM5_PAPLA|nr:hypothetical protein DB88DRAFT_510988 [Papiliotrema laurentii]